jgi:hypothetical protein
VLGILSTPNLKKENPKPLFSSIFFATLPKSYFAIPAKYSACINPTWMSLLIPDRFAGFQKPDIALLVLVITELDIAKDRAPTPILRNSLLYFGELICPEIE